MRILLLLSAAALFTVPAKADKFWLGDPDKQTVRGSSPDVIEGVLIDKNDTSYHIRVIGGELVLPKARVFKVEKDGLTLDKILEVEQQNRARLAKERERRALDRAAQRLRGEVEAAEAAASRRERSVEHPQSVVIRSAPAVGGFDPVIGRVVPEAMSHHELLAELELAWALTKDRRYLKALRRLRRLH